METRVENRSREPLSRERVLAAAVAIADEQGVDALSMRRLANELHVVPMALYKHVANKDELLDGMIDVVVSEIDTPNDGVDWKTAVRERILSARPGGFSIDLTHHVMHAMGSRLMGFTQELFNDQTDTDAAMEAEMYEAMAATFPSIAELYRAVTHDDASVVGPGCDDQFEFEFALDLLLDGIERLKEHQGSSEGTALTRAIP
jgi:AcrR family transcriptional regulator